EGPTVGFGFLTGTVPAAGAPGSPSSPTAINIVTANGAQLNLVGQMQFTGDLTMMNQFGTTTSAASPDSYFHGINNVRLTTGNWVQNTRPDGGIDGHDFIVTINQGGTIINTDGNVNFATNTTLAGHDFAIVAKNNVDLTGLTSIDLSNPSGAGGTL